MRQALEYLEIIKIWLHGSLFPLVYSIETLFEHFSYSLFPRNLYQEKRNINIRESTDGKANRKVDNHLID